MKTPRKVSVVLRLTRFVGRSLHTATLHTVVFGGNRTSPIATMLGTLCCNSAHFGGRALRCAAAGYRIKWIGWPSPMAASLDEIFEILAAAPGDVAELHGLVRALAEYEKLAEACVSQEADLSLALFGTPRAAEALIVRKLDESHQAVGFALFFHTYSTVHRPAEPVARRPLRPAGGTRERHRAGAAASACTDRRRARLRALRLGRPRLEHAEQSASTARWAPTVLPDWRIARVTGGELTRLASGT